MVDSTTAPPSTTATAPETSPRLHMSLEAFDAFVQQPANADKLFEFIQGEVVAVPSNPLSSKIALRLGRYLDTFADENQLGHVTGEQGGYQVNGQRFAPDVAYISFERQPELPATGYNPNPPQLAVEVISPTDRHSLLSMKIQHYMLAGCEVWEVDPVAKTVLVLRPGQPPVLLEADATLDGGELLPGFKLPLKKLFG